MYKFYKTYFLISGYNIKDMNNIFYKGMVSDLNIKYFTDPSNFEFSIENGNQYQGGFTICKMTALILGLSDFKDVLRLDSIPLLDRGDWISVKNTSSFFRDILLKAELSEVSKTYEIKHEKVVPSVVAKQFDNTSALVDVVRAWNVNKTPENHAKIESLLRHCDSSVFDQT